MRFSSRVWDVFLTISSFPAVQFCLAVSNHSKMCKSQVAFTTYVPWTVPTLPVELAMQTGGGKGKVFDTAGSRQSFWEGSRTETNWELTKKKHSKSSWSLIMSEIWWNQNNKHAACRMRWKWRKVPEVWFPETIPNPWWPTDSCDRRGYACNTYALGKAMSSSWNYSPFHTNSIPPVSGDILGSPHYPVVVFWKKRCFPASFC